MSQLTINIENNSNITQEDIGLVLAGLLHDVGKVRYVDSKQAGGVKHSANGYDYLEKLLNNGSNDISQDIKNGILEAAKYHHEEELKFATDKKAVSVNSWAYIVYMADYVAAALERINKNGKYIDYDFECTKPLEPVFNILNGNNSEKYYNIATLGEMINYPVDKQGVQPIPQNYYEEVIIRRLDKKLHKIELNDSYVDGLLAIFEEVLTYVPAFNFDKGDISLYDHSKMVAGLCGCIKQYVDEKYPDKTYKEILFDNRENFIDEKAFRLYSMDISGIQKFIYTIHSEGALKNLRARSFYLEIMMEHIIDCLLDKLKLTRANVIYAGGGHCYLILPNTEWIKQETKAFEDETKKWLIENYNIALFVGSGAGEASANILNNISKDETAEAPYSALFQEVSVGIEMSKIRRYTAQDIRKLNGLRHNYGDRECMVCKRVDKLLESTGDGKTKCRICASIDGLSKGIMDKSKNYFAIVKVQDHMKNNTDLLPLPGDYYMVAGSKADLVACADSGLKPVRLYAKNNNQDGLNIKTIVRVGNYASGNRYASDTFEDFANATPGFKKIGVLRADVDNLGTAFSCGFTGDDNTLSRTAALSRQLSIFFKYHLNDILEHGESNLNNRITKASSQEEKISRKAAVVYSGGDDLFIVGNWRDVIELGIDISEKFAAFTDNQLTISAGIGIYNHGYPISRIAEEVGALEDMSKKLPGKNGITLFPDGNTREVLDEEHNVNVSVSTGTFSWKKFDKDVITCLKQLFKIFASNKTAKVDKGNTFLYKLLELMRNRDDEINIARFAYMFAKLEETLDTTKFNKKEKQREFREFMSRVYTWIKEDDKVDERRAFLTAVCLYVYLNRKG